MPQAEFCNIASSFLELLVNNEAALPKGNVAGAEKPMNINLGVSHLEKGGKTHPLVSVSTCIGSGCTSQRSARDRKILIIASSFFHVIHRTQSTMFYETIIDCFTQFVSSNSLCLSWTALIFHFLYLVNHRPNFCLCGMPKVVLQLPPPESLEPGFLTGTRSLNNFAKLYSYQPYQYGLRCPVLSYPYVKENQAIDIF